MCLAISGKITKIQDMEAEIDYGGVSKRASIRLKENAKVGDIVLVHAGFVIQILDKDAGEELQKLVEETIRIT
jgi:hydrogenase expression/formation protein HypC